MKRRKELYGINNHPYHSTKPMYVKMSEETAAIIKNRIKNDIFYGVFPVTGDSMTCDSKRSIGFAGYLQTGYDG